MESKFLVEKSLQGKLMELIEFNAQTPFFHKWVLGRSEALTDYSTDLKRAVYHLVEARNNVYTNNETILEKELYINDVAMDQSSTFIDFQLERVTSLIKPLEGLQSEAVISCLEKRLKGINQMFQIDFRLPLEDPQQNQLILEVFSVLDFEQLVAFEQLDSVRILQRCVALLKKVDLAPETARADLVRNRCVPRFLVAACNWLANAENAAKNSVDLMGTAQVAWKGLIAQIKSRE